MSSAGDDQSFLPHGHAQPEGSLTVITVPVPASSSNKRPRSKHEIAMNKIMLDCDRALKAKRAGEITHAEFMQITNDCIKRAQARKQATQLLCARARRNEVSLEEFNRECGYSEEDWEKMQPEFEKDMEALEADDLRKRRARLGRNKNSRGH
ncbi:hypothetical protein DENSPDRAFT_872998 [Dentipellis sp. KUC8613]|nr:hypothetical protein DENSPDRAFT_872998 [Dentipellis sp. KUC8613]